MTSRYSFHSLALEALQAAESPLTRRELWDLAVALRLHRKLDETRRSRLTPWDTLGARLYELTKRDPDGAVIRVGSDPVRFWLRERPLPEKA